jgi:RNA-splicing ligase RtcB
VSIYYDKAWLTQLSAFPKVTNSSHRGGATIQWTRLKSQKQKEEKEMTKREKQKEKDMMKAEDMMKAKEIWYVVKHSTNVIETIESIARTLKTYRRKKK